MKACYYQGCSKAASTREHIPPKAFFPAAERYQLLTVPSCAEHNNAKSGDDVYVLAHISMNASPTNGAREVFIERLKSQLGRNGDALRKTLAAGSVRLPGGAVAYKVDTPRFDRFFTALSFGIIHKSCGARLPDAYRAGHVYHNFVREGEARQEAELNEALYDFYSGKPMDILNFGPSPSAVPQSIP